MSLGAVLVAAALVVAALALFLLVTRASRGRTVRAVAADVRSERDALIGDDPVAEAPPTGRFTRQGPVPRQEAAKALAGSGLRPHGGF